MKNPNTDESSVLFPEADCAAALGELSVWTSVQNLQAAARMLERRQTEDDDPQPLLIMPFEEQPQFEEIFMVLVGHLIRGYKVPERKIALARSLDSQILESTAEHLRNLCFRPTIKVLRKNPEADEPKSRAFFIADDPVTIELIQNPLRCLMGLMMNGYPHAKKIRDLKAEYLEKTGGAPTIFHRPYGDSRLFSLVEGIIFHFFGHHIGPNISEPGHSNVDISYRSINVCAVPPVNSQVFDMARHSMTRMLHGLR